MKPVLQLGDEARVHERLRFVVPDVGTLLGDVFIGWLQALRDGVGHRNEIFPINLVGAFEQFTIVGLEIFAEDLEAEFFVALQEVNAFHVGF